jgi:hypothetical protein
MKGACFVLVVLPLIIVAISFLITILSKGRDRTDV